MAFAMGMISMSCWAKPCEARHKVRMNKVDVFMISECILYVSVDKDVVVVCNVMINIIEGRWPHVFLSFI